MTVVSDKIARAFIRTQLTQALALGISKPFDRVYGITDLMEFQVVHSAFFFLFSVIGGFEWFWMGSLHKSVQLMM